MGCWSPPAHVTVAGNSWRQSHKELSLCAFRCCLQQRHRQGLHWRRKHLCTSASIRLCTNRAGGGEGGGRVAGSATRSRRVGQTRSTSLGCTRLQGTAVCTACVCALRGALAPGRALDQPGPAAELPGPAAELPGRAPLAGLSPTPPEDPQRIHQVHPPTHSPCHSPPHPSPATATGVFSFTQSPTPPHPTPATHPLIPSLTHPLTHSPPPPLTHSVAHSPTWRSDH